MVKHHGVFAPAFVLATLCFSALVMAEVPLLTNGSFDEGGALPSGWQKAECDEGKVRAFRDTDHFASAPASLCLESVDGPVRNGTIAQRIEDFTPGSRVGFSGLVKSDGNVDFAALALISPGVKDSWQELIVFPRIVEWKEFEATARIPEEAEDLLLVLLIHGEGKVWVDDLTFIPADSIQPSPIITDFSQSYSYSFLSFEDRVDIEDGIAHIAGENGKGGVGFLKSLDLSSMLSHTPVLWAKLGKENRASRLNLILDSGNEGKRTFSYSLEQANSETFTALQPEHALAISPKVADEPDTPFDPGTIKLFQIQGDWKPEKVDVFLDKIVLTPPDDSMRARRGAYQEQLAEQLERERRQEEARLAAIERLLNDAPHPEDGPNITRIGAATEDTIELVIEAGQVTPRKQYPYQEQSGDQIVPEKNTPEVLCRENGQVVLAPKGRVVLRKEEGNENAKPRRLGSYVVNENMISPGPLYSGEALSIETVDQTPAYRISSPKGGLPEPAVPAEVQIKSKPTGVAGNDRSVRYHLYLKLPAGKQLVQDAKYTIDLIGINTRQKQVEWTHRPKQQMAEAIHVSQIGFRPDDPMKRAFLSLWRGTGGSTTFRFEEFELIDEATGESVFSGPVRLHFPADRIESIRGDKNHTQTNVYHLDFSDFRRPGRYRVFISGLGTSLAFPIEENVWKQAFQTSMHGFLSHRSGIALGPPFTDYQRPRPMHPGDDTVIYQLERTFWSGEAASVEAELRRKFQGDVPASDWKTCPDAWGGYMDAGDWDRRSQHLVATWVHLELLDLFPEYFEGLSLNLPPEEANDRLPDVMNEALWNLDFYRRLQRPDGGVGGGVESTSHPRPGEASWQESLLLGAFAPDPETSFRYAACAAKAARLLKKYDGDLAATYATSAKKAWDWSLAHADEVIDREAKSAETQERGKSREAMETATRDMKNLAAVALLRLTGKDAYHRAFLETTILGTDDPDPGKQLHALFAYALLPEDLVQEAFRENVVDWFEKAARDSIDFARGNAFGITCRVPMLPVIGYVGYYSVPETSLGAVLPRAHYLTGKREYLEGALEAAQFSSGANPMNLTMTTGVGHRYPRHPLHIDSQHAGIAPPRGITVYGINDPAQSDGWVHTWFLNKTTIPDSRSWPSAESYFDLGNWPATNEYTVHQTLAPTSFYWGYLAAREELTAGH